MLGGLLSKTQSGQVKADNPVKRFFSIFLFPFHIDSGFCSLGMNATDDCYKAWKYTAAHLAVLHDGYGSAASGFAPV
ncbi:hypothetical protein SAMN05421510_10703 [Nitrosomonas ureae]|uniref:Uncharacterized protein n=1 Tax=Nitrosomonas ureae TaxID=44577 RepID=A0A1H9GNL5_9PROT|nr:hypothetical protein SAMN05421510_10703 [Nitrosomonas ureae]